MHANASASCPRKLQQLISAGILKQAMRARNRVGIGMSYCAGIFKQSLGARNRVGIGLSYRYARLHSLAELVPWNRFLGFFKV
jgi:hypothetical protein